MAIKGIDVSSHQKSINWTKVKNDGISFAIIRAGYGQVHKDDCFEQNIKGAIAAGIPVGIYWFSYALNKKQALEEAKGCIDLIKNYKITLPIFYDFEYDSVNYAKKNGITITKTLFNEFTKTFCDYIQSKGHKAGVYYNPDYKRRFVDESICGKYVEWMAHYTGTNNKGYAIHQYSESGKVSGISGNVDVNYLNDESLLKKTSLNINSSISSESARKKESITVDGSWGVDTTKALQKIFKTAADGIISNQPSSNRKYLSAAKTNSWKFKDSNYKAGSQLIKALQKKIGTTVDGLFGKQSVIALQKFLDVTQDGSMGKETVKALQKWINKNL
jgi:GH25 family lysozyme M1 (1,4-beta-N-acetylmuramidase)|uniref:lysozyme n=1 Tax=virus sp. ctmTa7 TaxID=2828255 RepID=A0A8S5RBC3_9VIRU|nr:MAG TPA: endolysin [virus sp. ctmTa7]